jgi:hypothetical protein
MQRINNYEVHSPTSYVFILLGRNTEAQCKPIKLQQRFSNCEAPPWVTLFFPRGTRVLRMTDTFILKEIWAHDKMYILVGTLLR